MRCIGVLGLGGLDGCWRVAYNVDGMLEEGFLFLAPVLER